MDEDGKFRLIDFSGSVERRDLVHQEPSKNTWLTCDTDSLFEHCHNHGIASKMGMKVTVPVLKDNSVLIYDSSFGFFVNNCDANNI